nr:immunoglobulin light chain junction region [Macaca mulatta]
DYYCQVWDTTSDHLDVF